MIVNGTTLPETKRHLQLTGGTIHFNSLSMAIKGVNKGKSMPRRI